MSKGKGNGGKITPIDSTIEVKAERAWVRIWVDEQNHVRLESNAPEHMALALTCDGAAALARKIASEDQPKPRILTPDKTILKPS